METSRSVCVRHGTVKSEPGRITMHLSNESLIVIVIVGLVAGFLAGKIVRGAGFGLIGDIIVGLVGALIGAWVLPKLGIRLGTGIVREIIDATIGAVILLALIILVRR